MKSNYYSKIVSAEKNTTAKAPTFRNYEGIACELHIFNQLF